MNDRKRIALIAHDNRKIDLLDWARFNRGTLARHELFATGTTGGLVEAELGLPVHRMPSGAGHDAMKLHTVMPQAMLFVRGGNAGISHNPLETITNDDAELCVRAFQQLLGQLATDRAG